MVTLVCKNCGKEFQSKLICTKFCSRACVLAFGKARKSVVQVRREKRPGHIGTDWFVRKQRDADNVRSANRRLSLIEHDAAVASWERENGVAERVVESGDVRTVIRGRVCVGFHTSKNASLNY